MVNSDARQRQPIIFLPFRIFFLSVTVLALAAILLRVMQFNGVISLPLAMPCSL